VLQQVQAIINGGLDRVRPGQQLRRIIADRWWSVREVVRYALQDGLQVLCWARSVKRTLTALAQLAEDTPDWQPVTHRRTDPATGQEVEEVLGYRLETAFQVYGLDQPVRIIVEWDGQPGSPKRARLAVGLPTADVGTAAACAQLGYRQRVEILLKLLLRRQDWSHFSGGPAQLPPSEALPLTATERLRVEKHQRQVRTRQANAQARLQEVEGELARLETGEAKCGVLGLSIPDLRSLAKRLTGQVQRAGETLAHLDAQLDQNQASPAATAAYAELDLTQESLLTQLKLDVFTAQETLVNEFIEVALKPVLREEAVRQAAQRQRTDTRSQSQRHPDEPLCTDVERLFQVKVANLERETILQSLLTQGGRLVWHPEQRILISVAHRFADRRMQAAYERYCVFLSRLHIQVPMTDGPEWLLLFTYEEPGADARFK
jgi:hypothetical protein